jgi:hypothetical protein
MVIAGYPVKYTFANAVQYAKAKLAVADPAKIAEYEIVGKEIIASLGVDIAGKPNLQTVVTERIKDILQPLGLDKNENFVKSLASSITQDLTAYDPATVGAIYRSLSNDEVFADYLRTYMPSKSVHDKAEQLLPNVHVQKLWREANTQSNANNNTNSSTNKV